MTLDAEDLRGLPPVLSDIARATSLKVALILAREVGGTERYIPKPVPVGSWLETLVGRAAAIAISELFPRQKIAFPRAAALYAKRRAIAQATGTAREIAQALGVTERYVYSVRADLTHVDPDAPTLFD